MNSKNTKFTRTNKNISPYNIEKTLDGYNNHDEYSDFKSNIDKAFKNAVDGLNKSKSSETKEEREQRKKYEHEQKSKLKNKKH